MRYHIHHAVIVTFNQDIHTMLMEDVDRLLKDSPGLAESETVINNYRTLTLGSDGSKEGWEDSREGDKRRDDLVALLRSYAHEDWIEVSYGGDEPHLNTKVLRHGGETK